MITKSHLLQCILLNSSVLAIRTIPLLYFDKIILGIPLHHQLDQAAATTVQECTELLLDEVPIQHKLGSPE